MIVLIFLFAYLSNVLAFDLFGDNVKKILGKKFLKPDADYYIQHHDETAFYLSSLWQQVLNKSDECSNEAERYLEYLRSPCISTLLFVTSLYRKTEKGMEDAVRDYAKDISNFKNEFIAEYIPENSQCFSRTFDYGLEVSLESIDKKFHIHRLEYIDRLIGIQNILLEDLNLTKDGPILLKKASDLIRRLLQVLIMKNIAFSFSRKIHPCTLNEFDRFDLPGVSLNPNVECIEFLSKRTSKEKVLIDFTDEHSLNRLNSLIKDISVKNSIVRCNFVPNDIHFRCDFINLSNYYERFTPQLQNYFEHYGRQVSHFIVNGFDGVDKVLNSLKNLKYLKIKNSIVANQNQLCKSLKSMKRLEYVKFKSLNEKIDIGCLNYETLRKLSIDWCASNRITNFRLNYLAMACPYTFPNNNYEIPTKSITAKSLKNTYLSLTQVPNSFKISVDYFDAMKFTDQLVKFQNFQIPSVSKYSFDNCTFEHPDSLSGHVKQLTLKNQKIDQVLQLLKTLFSSLFALNLDRLVMENVAQLNKLKELELPKLAKLKISNSNLNLAACEILSAFMVNMPSLKVLDLSGNSIAATDCKLLIDLALVDQKRTLALIIN